ncbi:MAG TPA: SprB repeat-containing protein, partial [Bacteroidia bacterium]|nr:SprB repeat-containing protein [Bacteroidia bacterium]
NTLPPSYYAVTVTDAASNTATNGVTVTEPAQIIYQFTTSDYIVNGTHYNLSSYTWHNGSISTNVAGGVAPYTYVWTNSATTANISSLDAGSYRITITDATSCSVLSDAVALTKPDRSDWTMIGNSNTDPATQFIGTTDSIDLSFRTNNNERLRIKANGNISANILTGTGYQLVMTDSSGAIKRLNGTTAPGLMPWTMAGNSGTSPSSQFMGTSDSVDLSFRTKNIEQFRIKANGTVKLNSLSSAFSYGQLLVDSIGQLVRVNDDSTLSAPNLLTSWYLGGNTINNGGNQFLGTKSYNDLVFKTNALNAAFPERMRITRDGMVLIATAVSPAGDFKLAVNGNIIAEEVHVKNHANWPDYVFSENYQLKSISKLKEFIETENHLPGLPSAKTVEKEGFDLGDMQSKLLQKIEELTLYIIKQDERIEKLEKSNADLKRKIK